MTRVLINYSYERNKKRGKPFSSWFYSMDNAEVAEKLRQSLATFKNPVMISTDFSQYDSTVSSELIDIDRKFMDNDFLIKMLAEHEFSRSEIDCILAFIRSKHSRIQIRRTKRLTGDKDTRTFGEVIFSILVNGTVFSGDPLSTT